MIRDVSNTGGQGIMFGMEGPSMSGTWVNPKTGHKFTVAECYLENNQMFVKTTTGQIYDYNMIQNYVQEVNGKGNAPSYPRQQVSKPTPIQKPEPIINEEIIIPEDAEILNQPIRAEAFTPVVQKQEDPGLMMIKRVLDKKSIPNFKLDICWEEVPTKQIETLLDLLGIESEEIIQYYVNRIEKDIDFYNEFKLKISELIQYVLNNIANPPKEEKSANPVKAASKPRTTASKKPAKKTTK